MQGVCARRWRGSLLSKIPAPGTGQTQSDTYIHICPFAWATHRSVVTQLPEPRHLWLASWQKTSYLQLTQLALRADTPAGQEHHSSSCKCDRNNISSGVQQSLGLSLQTDITKICITCTCFTVLRGRELHRAVILQEDSTLQSSRMPEQTLSAIFHYYVPAPTHRTLVTPSL